MGELVRRHPSVPYPSVYLRFQGFVSISEGSSVYDSNPNESLKRDFQDCAPVTRRNGPARKNLPPNDPKLLTAYKLQSAWANIILTRTFEKSKFLLAIMLDGNFLLIFLLVNKN